MSETRPQMVARAIEKNLRLVFKPAKSARMNDPRPVTLKLRAIRVALLRILAAERFAGLLRERRKRRPLRDLHFLACFPAVFHRMITPSIARPRRRSEPDGHFGPRGRLPIFRVARAPFTLPRPPTCRQGASLPRRSCVGACPPPIPTKGPAAEQLRRP